MDCVSNKPSVEPLTIKEETLFALSEASLATGGHSSGDILSQTSTSSRQFRVRHSRSSFAQARHRVLQTCVTKPRRKRLVFKNGECNVSYKHVKRRRQRYLTDIFTTLVDMQWRWILCLFIFTFTASWMLFAFIWWFIAYNHNDFLHLDDPTWKPCVDNLSNYMTALLFSIETQHTIGYGGRMTTDECPSAVLLMMMQSCCGVILQALMTGIVFAKLSRSKKRAVTLLFSKQAVICRRDGRLALLVRVGDMRRSHIIQTTVRGLLVQRHVTHEGEVLPQAEYDVNFSMTRGSNQLLLLWPLILQHNIDAASPFYNLSPTDLLKKKFELIVILEGVIESTGLLTQARTSYLPSEILWGHHFDRLIAYQRDNGQYIIDYSRFNSTTKVDCPCISAHQMAEQINEVSMSPPSPSLSSAVDESDGDFSGTESCTDLATRSSGVVPRTEHGMATRLARWARRGALRPRGVLHYAPSSSPISHGQVQPFEQYVKGNLPPV